MADNFEQREDDFGPGYGAPESGALGGITAPSELGNPKENELEVSQVSVHDRIVNEVVRQISTLDARLGDISLTTDQKEGLVIEAFRLWSKQMTGEDDPLVSEILAKALSFVEAKFLIIQEERAKRQKLPAERDEYKQAIENLRAKIEKSIDDEVISDGEDREKLSAKYNIPLKDLAQVPTNQLADFIKTHLHISQVVNDIASELVVLTQPNESIGVGVKSLEKKPPSLLGVVKEIDKIVLSDINKLSDAIPIENLLDLIFLSDRGIGSGPRYFHQGFESNEENNESGVFGDFLKEITLEPRFQDIFFKNFFSKDGERQQEGNVFAEIKKMLDDLQAMKEGQNPNLAEKMKKLKDDIARVMREVDPVKYQKVEANKIILSAGNIQRFLLAARTYEDRKNEKN